MTPKFGRRSAQDIVGQDGPIRVDENGALWIEGRSAADLADEYGTPLYVTSEAQIRANVRRLRDAFAARWPNVTLLFATKANANLAIRRLLLEEGVGGDCFGLGELALSLQAGVPPELLVLNGSNKQPPELRAAVEAGVTITSTTRASSTSLPAWRSSSVDRRTSACGSCRSPTPIRRRSTRNSRRSRPTRATTSGAWTGRRSSRSCRRRSSLRGYGSAGCTCT